MRSIADDMELDQLGRDAAEKYTVSAAPQWEKMSAVLDEMLPEEKKRRRTGLLWWLLPGLLVIGGGAYWLYSGKSGSSSASINSRNETAAAVLHPSIQSPTPEETKEEVPSPDKTIGDNKLAKITVTKNIKNIIAPSSPSNTSRPINRNTKLKSDVTVNREDHAEISSSSNKTKDAAILLQPANTPVINANNKRSSAKSSVDNPSNNNSAITNAPVAATTNNAVTIASNNNAGTAAQMQTEKNNEPLSNAKKTPGYRAFGKGWSLAFVAGVDKSTVKFRYGNDPGYNIGVMAGYYFNKHISLHSGAIYTQKNYKMAGEDFTAPKGSIAYYWKLENVEGFCRMWDVPLLLRYTFNTHGKNDFYLAAGLSSYFMTTENYNYFYYYQGSPVTRNANYLSDDTHLLSILHLSGAFETRIAGNKTLQIEPYAKLPLGGVGLGSIKLSSFGVNIALQLRQPLKK